MPDVVAAKTLKGRLIKLLSQYIQSPWPDEAWGVVRIRSGEISVCVRSSLHAQTVK